MGTRWSRLAVAGLLLGGCEVFYFEPWFDRTVDEQGNEIFADTPRNWNWFRNLIEEMIAREVAGKKAEGDGTWNEVWVISPGLSPSAPRENEEKYTSYVVERRRQEGLPEIDVWKGFAQPVEKMIAREAAGLELRSQPWDRYWLQVLGLVWRYGHRHRSDIPERQFECYVIGRRREEGLPELPGKAGACAGLDGLRLVAWWRAGLATAEETAWARGIERYRHKNLWRAPYDERLTLRAHARAMAEVVYPDADVRALAEAAGKGRVAEIDRLVASGVDPDARGLNGYPLLTQPYHSWSRRSKRLRGFKRLLEHGADPNAMFADGRTVMHMVSLDTHDDAFLKLALSHGGDPDARDAWGEPPLASDLTALSPRTMRVLLDAPGVDIEAPNRFGTTIAMKAAGFRDDLLYELLIRGADHTVRNAAGYNVLDRLAYQRSLMFPGTVERRNSDRVVDWLAARGVELPSAPAPRGAAPRPRQR